MKFFTQSFLYDDPWSIVSLAYFLRYPNPYAAHVLSCDVISREQTPTGTLLTTRLILKRGALPRWAPRGIVARAEAWVIEESEVDPFGKTVRCITKNLEHTKVLQVEESVFLCQTDEGKTSQTTEARVRSGFGWGLTKRIETHGLNKFKANMQRSREGVSLVLQLVRQSRLQPMTLGGPTPYNLLTPVAEHEHSPHNAGEKSATHAQGGGSWTKLKSWLSLSSDEAEPDSEN